MLHIDVRMDAFIEGQIMSIFGKRVKIHILRGKVNVSKY